MRNLLECSGERSDVLIIDEAGSKFITKCIPAQLSISVLKIRKGMPYINKPVFLLRLCKRVFQFRVTQRAFITAIVDVIKPKVIISFVDTSIIMGQLDLTFPQKLVISIQNGARMHMGGLYVKDKLKARVNKTENNFLLPHYFSFGEYEKDLIEILNIKYKAFYSIGSLKFGIFLENYGEKSINDNSVCYISEYVKHSSDNQYMAERVNIQKQVFSNLIAWNKINFRQVKVAMRCDSAKKESDDEISFFSNIGGAELIRRGEFSSYRTGYEADIVITTLSSLGYELFGAGKKVLFCNVTGRNKNFIEKRSGVDYIMRKLPDIVLLTSVRQDELNHKINVLINMDNKEYLSLTKEAREYYMKCEKKHPHWIVSEFISDFMQKETLTAGRG